MAGDPSLDPRYVAQFQRGYTGPVLAPPQTTTHSTRTSPVRIPGGPPASAPRIPDPPSAIERPESTARAVEIVEHEAPEEIVESHGALFEWALLGAGVVLFALAAVTFWSAATDITAYSSPYPSDQAVLIDARNRLAGPLLVASAVALSAWLAVRALRPRVGPRVGPRVEKDTAP
jgi:hypothetical protein